jgi:hypothetical protein
VNTDAFYAAASALCFTLLGFWWVVVQFRHAELTSDAGVRTFAFLISLQFILPGLVAMASLLSGGGALWRVVFGAAGLVGIAAVVVAARAPGAASGVLRSISRLTWIAVPFYALLAVFALAPNLARDALTLEPLQVEGYLLTVILLIGILLAWILFTDPRVAPPGASADRP